MEAIQRESDGETTSVTMRANDVPFATNGLAAPAIYADVIRGAAVMGEITKLSLVEHRIDAITDQVAAVHVAQLVIPTSQLRGWSQFFAKLADGLGQPDVIPE